MQRFFGFGGGTGGEASTSPKNRGEDRVISQDKENKRKSKKVEILDEAFNAEALMEDK